ncbi:hypothetical protein N7471_002219 [Penicillium samsonianum]|uniref:uncharacterized protein n=1 Tax=Penicillium samsonianum TaxID=1882272 RepID=UPI0025483322|nr:uncharacterized protein N7471_002219 [Penicillium samsonianum]KAJ6142766.1 hypothetical protein N7471_002219 [Penicillium samsonianum]
MSRKDLYARPSEVAINNTTLKIVKDFEHIYKAYKSSYKLGGAKKDISRSRLRFANVSKKVLSRYRKYLDRRRAIYLNPLPRPLVSSLVRV